MTAEEYLNNIRNIETELRNKESRLAKFRQDIISLQGIDYGKDRVDGGISTDIADKIARIEALEKQVSAEWDELISKREEAARKIEKLDNPKYKAVLLERYINCKSWEQVAVDLSLDYRWALRIHGKALRDFEKYAMKSH